MYDEAIPMINSANEYYSKLENRNDSSSYLMSLNALKDINLKMGFYEKATQKYHQGKALNASLKDKTIEAFLDVYEGFNQYELKNYDQSINLLNSSLPALEKRSDFSRLSMADYYLGLCYYDMGEKEKGIAYFKKVDSVFVEHNYTRPRFRKAYEVMIDYYDSEDDLQGQLWAVNQLLAVDKTLNTYYKGLNSRHNKNMIQLCYYVSKNN